MSDDIEHPASTDAELGQSAERFKAFCDAVIAIAMTLLILPLMEAVQESRTLTAAQFVSEHLSQLAMFTLSFVLIAVFWTMHHRLFDGVHRVTRQLVTLNIAWLAMIVWLPVSTAMVGAMRADQILSLLYVGTLVVATVLLLLMRLYLLRHPSLTTASIATMVGGLSANIALSGCYGITLIVSLIAPGIGNFAFFLCMFIGVLTRLIYPLLAPRFGLPKTMPAPRQHG